MRLASLANALLKSYRTLQTISIQLIQNNAHPYNYDDPLAPLGRSLIAQAPNLIEYKQFRPFGWESCRLLFPMPPAVQGAGLGQLNSKLKVLCLPFFQTSGFLSIHFTSLASFSIAGKGNRDNERGLSQFLQRHSKTLKHLRLPSLHRNFTETHFPLLEVLELDEGDARAQDFPLWILAPPNLKVRAQQIPFIPFSSKVELSSLWTSNVANISSFSFSVPHLHTLRIQVSGAGLHSTEFESLLKALKGRRTLYDINRLLKDINRITRMTRPEPISRIPEREPLTKLIIPFNQLNPQEITRLQEVVDLVVDSALEPDLWEIEI